MTLNEQGLKDGLIHLAIIRKTVETRVNEAERKYGEAEAELNAYRKLLGFVDSQRADFLEQLRIIEDGKTKAST